MKLKKKDLISFKKIYLFDLDGVILNSKKNMNLAWNSVRRELDIDVNFRSYFCEIGIPFKEILKKLKVEKKKLKELKKFFLFIRKKILINYFFITMLLKQLICLKRKRR